MKSFTNIITTNTSVIVIVLLSFIAIGETTQVASVEGSLQFWGDELASLSSAIQPTLHESILYSARWDGNGPIFNALLWFLYQIVPYGDKYLLILPQLFVALAIFGTGMAARRSLGNFAGIFSSIMLLVNINFIRYGNELRTYSLTVFISSLLLWSYFCRMKSENHKNLVAFALLMSLLVYTHYYAAVICLIMFIFDIILYAKRKVNIRIFFSYFGAALLFLPWFVFCYKYLIGGGNTKTVPQITELFTIVKFLSADTLVVVFTFIFSCVFVVSCIINERNLMRLYDLFFCVIVSVGYIVFIYMFSVIMTKYVNRSIMWHYRYFLVLLPYFIFVTAYLFNEIINKIKIKLMPSVILFSILLFYLPQQYIALKMTPSPTTNYDWMKVAADWIYDQQDIHNEDVGVLGNFRAANEGWYLYYIEQAGKREALQYINFDESLDSLKLINKLYTVEYFFSPLSSWDTKILNEHFDLIEENKNMHIKIWGKKQ